MDAPHREVSIGIPGGTFREGIHLCHIFNDDRERGRAMARFVQQGLLEGDRVLCLLDSATPHDIRGHLAELDVDLDAKAQAFLTGDAEATYCPGGKLDIVPLLEGLSAFCRASVDVGFTGARITGDMGWALRNGTTLGQLMSYELKATEYAQSSPVVAVCEYDARKFDGTTLMDVLSVHSAMIVRGQIVWNPYYLPPEEFLDRFDAQGRGQASLSRGN